MTQKQQYKKVKPAEVPAARVEESEYAKPLDVSAPVRTPDVTADELEDAYAKEYGWLQHNNIADTLSCILRELVRARLWSAKHG